MVRQGNVLPSQLLFLLSAAVRRVPTVQRMRDVLMRVGKQFSEGLSEISLKRIGNVDIPLERRIVVTGSSHLLICIRLVFSYLLGFIIC